MTKTTATLLACSAISIGIGFKLLSEAERFRSEGRRICRAVNLMTAGIEHTNSEIRRGNEAINFGNDMLRKMVKD